MEKQKLIFLIKPLRHICVISSIYKWYFSFYPTAFKGCQGIVFTQGVGMGGGKKVVRAVYQKLLGVGSSYLVGTLVRGCRCATSWSDLDLTLSLKILSRLYLGNRKV